MPSSRESSSPGIESMSLVSPVLAGGVFITSATWEAPDSVEEGLMERKISRDRLRLIKACV